MKLRTWRHEDPKNYLIIGSKKAFYYSSFLDFFPKNQTCEGGTPQNFCLAFIDEIEKHFFTKKTVGDIIILLLYTRNLDDMIYSS